MIVDLNDLKQVRFFPQKKKATMIKFMLKGWNDSTKQRKWTAIRSGDADVVVNETVKRILSGEAIML